MVFGGANAINLDTKGRLAMPRRYRDELQSQCEGKLIVTVDRARCLLIYPQPEWDRVANKLADLPSLEEQARNLQRMMLGYATDCTMDNHGRILLTPPLRDFAGLDKRVMLVGQGTKFELWDERTWNELCEQWVAVGEKGGPLSVELGSLTL